MNAHRKAWALYDAVHAHSGGCQVCGDDDEFRPDQEAFDDTGEIMCGDCWETEQERCEQARMQREEAEDRRRDNPLEPDFRRLGQ